MKKIYLVVISCICSFITKAQVAEDAFKISGNPVFGTARNLAIGGTMTGLGGEISSVNNNPAGLGFYKNGEFVLSPGFNFGKNKISYRETNNQPGTGSNAFNIGTSGAIFAGSVDGRNIKSAAIGFTVNKLADFSNNISYKGFNNKSSGAERYAEEFAASRLSIDDAIGNKYLSLPARLALYTYLIDTFKVANGTYEIFAAPEFASGVNQERREASTGGIHEYALSVGINKNEKVFWGFSFGMPVLNHQRETYYSETDANPSVTNNGFSYFNYTENLHTKGIGFNGKLGVIIRPVDKFRLGISLITPTYYSLTDKFSGTMNAKEENTLLFPTRNLANTSSASTKDLANGLEIIESKYSFLSPWKISAGASYVFREIENVKKQRAFIAADIEYVTYKSMHFSSTEETQGTQNHYSSTNQSIKDIYKNVLNFKIGGEIKFNTVMFRLGGAFYGNPNADAVLKSSRLHLSGGLGYRHKGIFIDATYVHQINKGVDFPYRLADKANTYAAVKNTTGTVMITVGTKF
jgi:hypothetical protein